MGISTDPDEDDYGDDQGECFPPGLTPKFLWVSFAEIVCKSAPLAAIQINTTYKVEQHAIDPTTWKYDVDGVIILLRIGGGWSRLTYTVALGTTVFDKQIALACQYYYENNQQVSPPFAFIAGHAQVAWREPTYCPSLAGVAEQLVIPRDAETMAEFGPISATQFWAQFAKTQDGTNLQIKFDLPHFDQYNLFDRP